MAEIMETPSIPVPLSLSMFVSFTPPIATTGIFTASHISLNTPKEAVTASFFVLVVNTAPTPR